MPCHNVLFQCCISLTICVPSSEIPGKLRKFHSLTAVPTLQPVFMYLNRGGSRILETGGPKSEGEARIEGAKCPRIDGEAREKVGERSGEGAR